MLCAEIEHLIREEQACQSGRFIDTPDLDAYLVKLAERAEILADSAAGACRGFVAFYCNDLNTRQAYITLVLVDPRHRASGLGRALVTAVLEICRQRGFATCRLEVRTDNDAANSIYRSMGFRPVEDRAATQVLEITL
jgi:ribosomal protein S18 acetylase RimI-like enzyme